jgi:pyruvate,orthophosphate dikinase
LNETRSFVFGSTLGATKGLILPSMLETGSRWTLHAGETDNADLDTLLEWAVDRSSTAVRANADTPEDAAVARRSGAQGIGLCRTEQMFFGSDRLPHVRSMIHATNINERKEALCKLLPMQREDFAALFRETSPLPVTIRLLDPPLHEFLPKMDEVRDELELAHSKGDTRKVEKLEALLLRVQSLTETNPMMGPRFS